MSYNLLRPVRAGIFLAWIFGSTIHSVFSQSPGSDFRNAVSSDAFLNDLSPSSLLQSVGTTEFPNIAKNGRNTESSGTAIPVGYTTEYSETRPQPVSTAQFESPTSPNAIGSGIADSYQPPMPLSPGVSQPPAVLPSSSLSRETPRTNWLDRLGLDRDQPNFQVGYEVLSFHRSNDSVGPYSQNQGLSRFDQDVSGRYSFSRLLGGIERIEFKFTGPFLWNKQSSTMGPIDSNFSSSISAAFDQAGNHQLEHQIRLSSYELNRCWSSDELSTFFYGLRFLDHSERFQLDAMKSTGNSSFQLETNNFLAGGQIGLNLHRPISQRLTLGFEGGLGLYANFANGSLNAIDSSTTLLDTSDTKLRLTSTVTTGGRINYRLSERIIATGAYEYWYFPGLATAADQHLSSDAQLASLALRTGDDQLFRGWSIGLSARF